MVCRDGSSVQSQYQTQSLSQLPAVVFPTGEPEGAVAAVAVRGQVIREPPRHLGRGTATASGTGQWQQS